MAFRYLFSSITARHVTRSIVQPRNVNLVRNYATKIEPKKKSSSLRLLLIGGVIGGTVGALYSVYDNIGKKKPTTKDLSATILDSKPDVKVMRKIINSNDKSDLDIVLFQFQTCPFCCKVRSFLDYSGLSYSVVEVDAVLRDSIKWSESKKVPIVLVKSKSGKYVQLNDSSMIISAISSILVDPVKNDIAELVKYYPVTNFTDVYGTIYDIANKYFLMFQDKKPKDSKETFDEERKWRSWADNHLVHLISPNVYRTYSEARETFNWFSEVGQWSAYFPEWERNLMVQVGTFAMWLISKRLTKKHGLGDDVRTHLYDACDKWMGALEKKQTKFMGGNNEPNLADLSVYGVLCSMEGCEAFKDCLENTRIGHWFYDVKNKVESNRGFRKPLSIHAL